MSYNDWCGLPFARGSTVQVVEAGVLHKPSDLSFRRSTLGPETDLVEWFLGRSFAIPPGHRATIFREPRLPSGFPDLVVVIWDESTAQHWTRARAALTVSDLRLMHLLTCSGPQTERELKVKISDDVADSLVRLAEASMIVKSQNRWRNSPLRAVFAATQIIAIEAKVKEWRQALDQAHLNTWFASQSCILVPKIPRNSPMVRHASKLGVTVLTKEELNWEVEDTAQHQPRSYVSWLFNDWAWKVALRHGG